MLLQPSCFVSVGIVGTASKCKARCSNLQLHAKLVSLSSNLDSLLALPKIRQLHLLGYQHSERGFVTLAQTTQLTDVGLSGSTGMGWSHTVS